MSTEYLHSAWFLDGRTSILVKVSSLSPQIVLPSSDGPLSREVPSTAIAATNKAST